MNAFGAFVFHSDTAFSWWLGKVTSFSSDKKRVTCQWFRKTARTTFAEVPDDRSKWFDALTFLCSAEVRVQGRLLDRKSVV